MKTYRSSETVNPGFYFNLRQLHFRAVPEAGPLPGAEGETYHRVPLVLMLLAAPVIGGAFVMFLPVIGFVMLGGALLRKGRAMAADLESNLARLARPAWQPMRAFLHHGKSSDAAASAPTTPAPTAAAADPWAEQAQEKIDRAERG